jgi:signal transduction histidine kinase
MQWLPPLAAGSLSWRLAMSDRSAVAMARAILADAPASAIDVLGGALRVDPPLALWAVCRAKQNAVEPRDATNLARWLASCLIDVLYQPGTPPRRADSPSSASLDIAETSATLRVPDVEQAVARAELATALAAAGQSAVAEEAYLAGLLHGPSVWFEAFFPDAPAGAALPLPDWLASGPAPAIAAWIAEAVALLADPNADATANNTLVRARARGAEAGRNWADSPAVSAFPLAALIDRLGHLKTLALRFEETLEARKLEAMAEFAAGAGHEINNPLAVIAGRAQLLLQEETDPERRRTLALMNTQAKRVYEMIADMMLFARPPAPAFEEVDLVALVDRVIDDLRPQMAEQAVSLRRAEREGPLAVEADPTQLNVALRALCRNSLEAIGHDGRVEIELDETAQEAILRVRDNGPGISEMARRHLFDPYYSERQAGRGLGLGLSKCWRIVVTNHHGSIAVESQPRSETIFTLAVPKQQL